MKRVNVALAVVRAIVYIGLFCAFYFLFTQQVQGTYPSDLPNHIKPFTEGTYSTLRIVYQGIIGAFGIEGVCAFLALVEIAALALTEYLIRKLVPTVNPWVAFIASIACNVAIAIYVPIIHSFFTVGSPGGNCWHNSTYNVMKLTGLATMLFYFQFDGRIATRSKAASWVMFTVLLTATTAVKPSFVIVFGPAVFVLCLVDLKREGTSSVKRSLLIGLALVVALLVVFWQLTILFPSDGSGEGGIAFGLAKVWRARHANIFVSFFQSLAFPLLVVALTRRKVLEDRMFMLAWLMLIIAMAQYVFLYETGERTYHGNFGWGLTFAMFYLFVISCVVFISERGNLFRALLNRGGEQTASQAPVATGKPTALDYITLLVFALHVGSGVWYFIRIMMGHSYY